MASDVGATITGVTEANMHQFLYELGWAVAKGQLKPDKYGEAVKASGLDTGSSGFDSTLVSTIWCASDAQGKESRSIPVLPFQSI